MFLRRFLANCQHNSTGTSSDHYFQPVSGRICARTTLVHTLISPVSHPIRRLARYQSVSHNISCSTPRTAYVAAFFGAYPSPLLNRNMHANVGSNRWVFVLKYVCSPDTHLNHHNPYRYRHFLTEICTHKRLNRYLMGCLYEPYPPVICRCNSLQYVHRLPPATTKQIIIRPEM